MALVSSGGAAVKAGVQEGDRIIKVLTQEESVIPLACWWGQTNSLPLCPV